MHMPPLVGRRCQTRFFHHSFEAFTAAFCLSRILAGNISSDKFFFFLDKFLLCFKFSQLAGITLAALLQISTVISTVAFQSWSHLPDLGGDLVKKITVMRDNYDCTRPIL